MGLFSAISILFSIDGTLSLHINWIINGMIVTVPVIPNTLYREGSQTKQYSQSPTAKQWPKFEVTKSNTIMQGDLRWWDEGWKHCSWTDPWYISPKRKAKAMGMGPYQKHVNYCNNSDIKMWKASERKCQTWRKVFPKSWETSPGSRIKKALVVEWL